MGTITADEAATLKAWREESSDNEALYQELMQRSDLADRYVQRSSIDADKAWKRFARLHFNSSGNKRWWIAAACIAAIVLTATTLFMMNNKSEELIADAPQMHTEEVQALNAAINAGKQSATLIADGKEIKLEGSATAPASKAKEAVECELITEDGKEYWVTLSDGTIVHLNYNSRLTYPSKFSKNSRTVQLTGEAYFKVAHNSKAPFQVVTPNGAVVKDYGTEFNVSTRSKAGTTEVVLVEGSASISNKSNEYMLNVGQRAAMNMKGDLEINRVNLDATTKWNRGTYIFEDCRLADLVQILRHWYDADIDLQSGEDLHFTGSIDRYGNIEDVLKAIKKVTGLKITREDRKYVLN